MSVRQPYPVGGTTIPSPLPVTSGGTGTVTQFTAGSVVFSGVSGVYSQNNAAFFWDNSSAFLGIGTNGPTYKLDMQSTQTLGLSIWCKNAGTSREAFLRVVNDSSFSGVFEMFSSTYTARNNFCWFSTDGAELSFFELSAAPIKLYTDSQIRLTISSTGDISIASGKIIQYNGVTTAGQGVPAIYGSGRSAAQVAAVASVAAYTVGAADASFRISANVNVTTATAHNFTVTCAYTDEGNVARTLTLGFTQLTGATFLTAITNITGAGPYESPAYHIRCKASTAITIATTGTFTTVTYNVEGSIIQIA